VWRRVRADHHTSVGQPGWDYQPEFELTSLQYVWFSNCAATAVGTVDVNA